MIVYGTVVGPRLARRLLPTIERAIEDARRNGAVIADDVVEFVTDLRHLADTDAVTDAQTDVDSNRATLDAVQVAAMSGVKRHTIADAIRRQRLPAKKVGRQWRIDPDDVNTWLASRAGNEKR